MNAVCNHIFDRAIETLPRDVSLCEKLQRQLHAAVVFDICLDRLKMRCVDEEEIDVIANACAIFLKLTPALRILDVSAHKTVAGACVFISFKLHGCRDRPLRLATICEACNASKKSVLEAEQQILFVMRWHVDLVPRRPQGDS